MRSYDLRRELSEWSSLATMLRIYTRRLSANDASNYFVALDTTALMTLKRFCAVCSENLGAICLHSPTDCEIYDMVQTSVRHDLYFSHNSIAAASDIVRTSRWRNTRISNRK